MILNKFALSIRLFVLLHSVFSPAQGPEGGSEPLDAVQSSARIDTRIGLHTHNHFRLMRVVGKKTFKGFIVALGITHKAS